ncbi:unnamed protein product [Rotaria sp. Silwood1]|nr:unnamed protein product [Rotaria sp. Silwood1]
MSITNNEDVTQLLIEMKIGSELIKRKPNGEKYSRQVYLDEHEDFVSYRQSEKFFSQPRRYYIQEINEIRLDLQTSTSDQLVNYDVVDRSHEQYAFCIFYNNYRDELHLMAKDEHTRDMWVQGLQYLIDRHGQKQQRHIINETNWISNQFYMADKDGSGTISKDECRQLLKDSFNANISEDLFEIYFEEANESGDGNLTSDEFLKFFHLLTRRKDLYKIMQQYVKKDDNQSMNTIYMDIDELLYFLQNVQNQKVIVYQLKQFEMDYSIQPIVTRRQVEILINQFETDIDFKEKGQLSLNGFRNLLLSDDFSLMKPWCSRLIYQDMTRPLSHYYINTSHNTYLFNTQVYGDSNPEAYNRVIRAGCRAVEIDCHDGNNGQPIVKHGHTLVRPCLFETIIRLIEPILFKTSPYPIILDIENHCSIQQQHVMARILQEVFGDRLISEPLSTNNSSTLPSPEDLKYKVLLRVIDNDLSSLFVYLQNVPYLEYEYAKANYSYFHSANISEKLFNQIIQSDPMGLIKQTTINSLRMYPSGLRQDSSNPNPIIPWNCGIQMVALNYGTDDPIMSLLYGKFLDNGGCGYILKPEYLIDIDNTKFNPFGYLTKPLFLPEYMNEYPQRLIITIISGQFLSQSNVITNDIPDLYVVVSTHGISFDQQVQKTKIIENNGFDPIWNETFEFDISFPRMCLVSFDVYDYNKYTKHGRFSYFCLPMTTIQTGYRHIHLRTKDNNPTYSTLFIHVAIEDK